MLTQSRSQTKFSKKNCDNTRILIYICTKKKNCSALFGILSLTFMNEIRTGMPIPLGSPSSPTATANKKNDMGNDCNWTRTQNHLVLKRTLNHLAKLTHTNFNLSSLFSLTNK